MIGVDSLSVAGLNKNDYQIWRKGEQTQVSRPSCSRCFNENIAIVGQKVTDLVEFFAFILKFTFIVRDEENFFGLRGQQRSCNRHAVFDEKPDHLGSINKFRS